MRGILIFIAALAGLGLPVMTLGAQRDLLWRAVQACAINHKVTGLAFPCLAVEDGDGAARGYAILRALGDGSHLVLAPTTRTSGIEADRLRGPDAPNYFADAWKVRHYLVDGLNRKPDDADIGVAVNSKPGRSQDQLHLHLACVRPEVQRAVADAADRIKAHPWTQVRVLRYARHYITRYIPAEELASTNLIDAVAAAFQIQDPRKMEDVTMVLVGARPSGFFVMARRKAPRIFDQPHAEALLDPDCSAFR